jgi:hypothetical protein
MFRKGKSGNPGGRPKKRPEDYDLELACKGKTPQAFETLVSIMEHSEIERNRLLAVQMIIERAHGKPRQTTEITGKNGTPITIKEEKDLFGDELIAELKRRGLPTHFLEE